MKSKTMKWLLCALCGLLVLFVAIFGGRVTLPAFAATVSTGALADLRENEDFSEKDYPDNASDYSVTVIHVAESADGALFIYTYQPSQKTTYLVATGMNMSLTAGSLGTELYALTLLKSDGVFCKYQVKDFTVSDGEIRYYNISKIHREYNSKIDVNMTAVSYRVGKLFIVNDTYTSAYDDLQQDASFDETKYPDKANDYSIKVIQIAEGAENELYVYTYQPCQRTRALAATHLNMSLSESVDRTRIYGLTLVSVDGVIGKYKVNELTINSAAETRYYNITSIYRTYDREIDPADSLDNQTGKVSFAVGKVFFAQTVDGVPVYFERKTDVVEITDKYVGNVRYDGGLDFGWGISRNSVNAMYVAFSTDRDISRLFEADVSYSKSSYGYKVNKVGKVYDLQKGDPVPQEPVTLSYTAKHEELGYEWYEIQSVEEFKANMEKNEMELTTDAQAGLEGKQWVLNFATVPLEIEGYDGIWMMITSIWAYLGSSDVSVRTEIVSDVSILRLKFEEDGKVYDLGAVDSMKTGSGKPSNRLPGFDENNEHWSLGRWLKDKFNFSMPWWGWFIIGIVALAILLPVLGLIIPPFGKFLLKVLKGIWWLISAPFRGIAALFSKNKGR